MSFDRKISQVCPHWVTDEALWVGSDRQTIRPLRPIAASHSVSILINHTTAIPSYGVGLPARSIGTAKGPFTILVGQNDRLVLDLNGAVQSIQFPHGYGLSAERVAQQLNRITTGIDWSVQFGRVRFSTKEVGDDQSLWIDQSSTLANTLGILTNRHYRGIDHLPGWTLIQDPTTLSDRPTRLVVFDRPLRSADDFVEISYSTVQEECRRCGGIGIEDDWRYNAMGNVVEIRDSDLLIQEVTKLFLTNKGSNPFHKQYGSGLIDYIGQKISKSGFGAGVVQQDLQRAFVAWQKIKQQQETTVGQAVSDEEYPLRLQNLTVTQSTDDPTVAWVDCTIQSRSRRAIQLSREVQDLSYRG